VSVTHLPVSDPIAVDPPRIAFAVPRKVGTAVVRNRLRRQVRAHLDLRQRSDQRLSPGAYLVALAPGAADQAPATVLADLDRCLDKLAGAR
jgi:ribonuclease P protein component